MTYYRQGLVWWCMLTVTLIPALKVEVRKAGFQSQPQPQESLSLKGVERGRGGILISSCVGEEVVVYPDSQFLAWATWVLQEIAEEDPGDGLRKTESGLTRLEQNA